VMKAPFENHAGAPRGTAHKPVRALRKTRPRLQPVPTDIATCMYYTGIDPFTKQEVFVARHLKDRKLQRALMQFFKAENYFTVREALIQAGRQDLIGSGCDCLIPAQPPREAIEARRRRASQAARLDEVEEDHYHAAANPARGEKPGERGLNSGYRPGRKSAKRRKRKGKP
jgi:Domain of unknown function (DUF3362)